MVNTHELRLGNLISYQGKPSVIFHLSQHNINTTTHGRIKAMDADYIPLTKEWTQKLGFEITDVGDHWEFEKNGFILHSIKSPITGKDMDPFYILQTDKAKYVKVKYVHKLQNLYYEVQGEFLNIVTALNNKKTDDNGQV